MQIDFHHTVTYTVGRLAGLNHRQAQIVAYCAQYVDNATNAGLIRFDNGAMYHRISSAHKMLDYRNFKALANHQVWIPFHFLPGNASLPAGKNPKGSFIHKLICRPNSPVAQDMMRDCILDRDRPYGLYRLGVAMHVYADTWAHQGFAGVIHRVNDAEHIRSNMKRSDRKLLNKIVGFFVGDAFPLGHGAVLSYPDRPYLVWRYTNGRGERVRRDNPRDFLEAADCMCKVMQQYRLGDPNAFVPGLPEKDKRKIGTMLRTLKIDDGEERHKRWLEAIRKGHFSFGPATITYIPKGVGSWKHRALGTREWVDSDNDIFPYKDAFLRSHWKMFHDALQAHRFKVLHEILPPYGICAA